MDEQQEMDASLKCETCGATFDTHEQLELHEGLAHLEEATEPASEAGMHSEEDAK
jgi:hypothetical protein